MDATALREELKRVPLFWGLEDSDLDRFTTAVRERAFAAGQVVVEQGDEAEEWFLIREGEFEVYVRQRALDFEKSLTLLGPGGHFGEVALFLGSPRTASVRAVTDGKLAALDRETFLKILRATPELSLKLCQGLAEYLVRAEAHAHFVLPFVDLDTQALDKAVTSLIPPRTSIICRAVALERKGDLVTVGMVDPYDEQARSFIVETLPKLRIEFVAVSEQDFDRYEKTHIGTVSWASLPFREVEDFTYITPGGQQQLSGQQEGARLVHEMLSHALRLGASDLHFEPGAEAGKVRSRVDGKLLEAKSSVPLEALRQAVSRLKVLADLDITERRAPQDGSFRLKAGQHEIDVRVATTPCFGGEKAVLRVLDPLQQKTEVQTLVLWRPVALQVRELFLQPSGLALVTGPTGAGKTTTLYAGLSAIWASSKTCNIVTIEDPIEYRLPFATQVQVNRAVDLDFPRILRATLRQDPNIILVGEIRDRESGAIALEAAGTGHLVLSSLHTHFALDSIRRLRNLDLPGYLIAGTLKGIISQRLVAQVCRHCAAPMARDTIEEQRLRRLGILPDDWGGQLTRGTGCENCRFTGEVGRVGMYELLLVGDALRDRIEQDAPFAELEAALQPDEFVSMARYARYLLEEGLASPDSVYRTFPRRLAVEEEPPAAP